MRQNAFYVIEFEGIKAQFWPGKYFNQVPSSFEFKTVKVYHSTVSGGVVR